MQPVNTGPGPVANLDNLTSTGRVYQVEQQNRVQQCQRLQSGFETLEKQAARDKMIIKFRDQRIAKLEEALAGQGTERCSHCAE